MIKCEAIRTTQIVEAISWHVTQPIRKSTVATATMIKC